jgi:hypothetical protein
MLMNIAAPQVGALSPERLRVEQWRTQKDMKRAARQHLIDEIQADRDKAAAIERYVPVDSPYRGLSLGDLARVELPPVARATQGRAENDPRWQLMEMRRVAVHRDRIARLRVDAEKLGAEAGALNELVSNCTRWLDARGM